MANPHKTIGIAFGVVFLAVGALGFVVKPTLIAFGVNMLHNVVHLLSGAVLLAGALMDEGRRARQVNLAFGAVYLLVAVLGFALPALTDRLLASGADAFPFADAALHLVLGLALVGSALAIKETSAGKPAAR